MKRTIFFILLLSSLMGYSFPRPSEEWRVQFTALVVECAAFQSLPEVAVSSHGFMHRDCPAFRQLAKSCGVESLELIYATFSKASPLERGTKMIPLVDLWGKITRMGCVYQIPWTPRGIIDTWECGAEYYEEQITFLLKEMRLAKEEGRKQDELVCKQLISCEGIFSFQKLFSELEAGHEDVIDILGLVWRHPDCRPTKLDKKSLLLWWKENQQNYVLPRQVPGFKKTKDIHHWQRSGK